MAIVIDPAMCQQATVENPQPRAPMFKFAFMPMTDGNDLISTDEKTHKVWRARLNPGFSPRNLVGALDAVVDECSTFAELIKQEAGSDGGWGVMFQMYERTVAMTFDIILRMAL